ncbi:MAG: Sec-independent protein translocase subunit TatA/TatB [Planctomycetota bacterium]
MDICCPATILAWTPGWGEIVIILVVLLVLFGGKKLPELARGLGRGMREFKDELKGTRKELEDSSTFDDDYHVEEETPAANKKRPDKDENA